MRLTDPRTSPRSTDLFDLAMADEHRRPGGSTPTASGPATTATRRAQPLDDLQNRADASQIGSAASEPTGIAGDRRRPVLAAGAVCWQVIDGQGCRCCSCTARSTTMSRCPRANRPGRDAARRPRCARSPRRPAYGRARRAARRRRVPAAERPREGRALLGGRGRRARDRATPPSSPNDEVDDLEWVTLERGARRTELPARRRHRWTGSPSCSTRAVTAPSRSSRCGTARRCRPSAGTAPDADAAAHRARRRAGGRASRTASPRSGRELIISSPAVRCVTTVAPIARRHRPE